MLLYSDPLFLEHITGSHPERPARLVAISKHLDELGLTEKCTRPKWERASLEQLAHVHAKEYVTEVEDFVKRGGGRIEADTMCSPKSFEVATLAAGAVCDAVRRVVKGEERHALCLVRPPGHHALEKSAMGFCLFNNVAVGARLATKELELDRVLVVDWDVHHGNGTQDMFWADERVGFLSIHRWPFYPGTGRADETGTGSAIGTKLNLPVELGTPRKRYIELFAAGLEKLAARIRPQLVIVSAGFDAHRDDPIGSLGLECEDFIFLSQKVLEVAKEHAGGKVVSALEGGYNPPILAKCVELHLREMLQAEA